MTNILLDTHIAIWASNEPERLKPSVRELIEDMSNEVMFSIASAWEVSIKFAIHPERIGISGREFIDRCLRLGFAQLPIDGRHIAALDELPFLEETRHFDPFDRMLIAQAMSDKLILVTHDSKMLQYDMVSISNE